MLLLIPGPVTTHPDVRAAANRDVAPWDQEVRDEIARLLVRLRNLAGGRDGIETALSLPGCGHFIVEAAIRSFVLPAIDQEHGTSGGILIPATGQYSERMMRLARSAGRRVTVLPASLTAPLDPAAVEAALAADPTITHLGLVYSETSSGIIHDPEAIGAVVRRQGRRMILDAVSAFGALPVSIADHPEIDAMVFSANKCLEGLPGFGVAVSPIARLLDVHGKAGSWSFDLGDVYANGLENGPGAARFTPPIQPMVALHTALDRLDAEGGPPARLRRYRANMDALFDGMESLGLRPILTRGLQGPIIMNVAAPAHPDWDLKRFVEALKRRGVLISNFKNTEEPSMRIGAIGAIGTAEIHRAVAAMGETLDELGWHVPASAA
ncbi:MAG TPA: aminotransferase class V-fold PLP-dependent enzyme [Acidisoma sp.]|uniref:aminotransferase class V-fold PLP-dependent enzyme n=1 Tax=Acidisoma sp. TaxID=1872115 RepID=UPI002BB18042|nr:aminotransferase class V-fold PLP-dependent enzyme [Acidisoma sp.]HTI00366.1 aminotransferase class V-fold PLP-dependent enzyme [Acidisoma sp.]